MKHSFTTFLAFGTLVSRLCAQILLSPGDFNPDRTDESVPYMRQESSPQTLASSFSTKFVPVKPGDLLLLEGETRTEVLSPLPKPSTPVTMYAYWYDARKQPLKSKNRTWLLNAFERREWGKIKKMFQSPEGTAYMKLSMGAWQAHVRSDYRNFRLTKVNPAQSAANAVNPASAPDESRLTGQAQELREGTRSSISLGGVWGFLPVYEKEKNGKWETIRVPGYWGRVDGFNLPKKWTEAMSAVYQRYFTVPEDWRDKRVSIHFGAVMCKAGVYVNGRFAGEHLGSYTPFQFDISKFLVPGKNTLRVEVDGPAKAGNIGGNYIVMADYATGYGNRSWGNLPRGGIWQDVRLCAEPRVSVRKPYVKTSVLRNELEAEVTIENPRKKPFSGTLKVFVSADKKNRKPVVAFPEKKFSANEASELIKLGPLSWKNPRLWSPEDPHLYFLVMEIFDSQNKLVDRSFLRFGFRDFHVKGKEFYLNGKIRRLRGDSFRPTSLFPYNNRSAVANAFRHCREDLNLNLIRYHCSIPDPVVLEVADETGMLLDIQSAIVGGGERGGHYLFPGLQKIMMKNMNQEFTEWVLRDRNHPSLIIWNLENEFFSCFGEPTVPITKELERTVRKLDNTRVVTRGGCGNFDGSGEFVNLHAYDGASSRIMIRYMEKHGVKPFANTEFWANLMPQNRIGEKAYRDFHTAMEEFGRFFKEYIEYQRARGTAAIYPFMLTSYVYGPFCYYGKLKYKWDSPVSSTPQPDYTAGFIPAGTDGPFNPGNFPDKPSVLAHKEAIRHVAAGFRPLHIMLYQPLESTWAGGTYENTAVIVNDTDQPQKAGFTVSLRLNGTEQQLFRSEEYSLDVGGIVKVPLKLSMPETAVARTGSLHLELVRADGKNASANDYELTLYPPAKRKTGRKRIAFAGTPAQRRLYAELGIETVPFRFSDIGKYDLVIFAENIDTAAMKKSSAKLWEYIENGGRLLLLPQENSIAGLLPGRINIARPKVYFNRVLEHLPGFPAFYYNKSSYLHAPDPSHPVWRGISGGRLCNWNNEDLGVTTGGTVNQAAIQGACRPLTTTVKNEMALFEYFYGKGLLITGTVDFEKNLRREPQAAHLLVNIVDYLLNAKPRIPRTAAGYGKEMNRLFRTYDVEGETVPSLNKLSGQTQVLLISPGALNADTAKAVRAELENGCDVLVFYDADSRTFLQEFGLRPVKVSCRDIAFPNGKPDWLSGFSAFNFRHGTLRAYDTALDTGSAPGAREVGTYVAMQGGWEYPYPPDHPWIPKYKCAAAELKIGKGRLLLFPWAALKHARLQERAMFQNFVTGLGGAFRKQAGEFPEVGIIRAGEVKIDGDLTEWTYDKTVEELISHKHAAPIVLSGKVSEVNGTMPENNKDCSGIIYFMYDDKYLYFAGRVVDDKLVFNQPPGLYYRADSLDFFVNSVQVQVSLRDGVPAYTVSRNTKAGKDEIRIAFRKDRRAGSRRDMHLIGKDAESVEGAPGYVFEGRIPWSCFTEDGKPPKRFYLSAGINDCDDPAKNDRDCQLCYPKGYRWRQFDTMAEAVLE